MTATLRTTAFVSLASLLVGIGGVRAQQMEPPPFEQTQPPRVVPPPPPPPPRPAPREQAPPPAPREQAPAAAAPPSAPAPPPRQPPSSSQWRLAPPAPPVRTTPAPSPSVQSPPVRVQAPPPPVQSPPVRVQAPPPSVQSPPVRVQAPRPSPARPDADDAVDDPKMWRRLGPRVSVPAPSSPAVRPPPPARARPPAPATARPAPAPLPPLPLPPPAPDSAPAAAADADQTTLVRPYTPARGPTFEPTLPRLKLGLRRFDFVRIGASNSPDGVAATQTFNSFSVDVYPVSRGVRVGLTSAFGWESGTFVTNGDYFATQTLSLGAQYRDFGRVVPFAEAFVGVGYMRRLQFDRTIPTAFWNFGVDAGVEIYVAKVGYLSLALGYMRPVNGFARRQIFTSVYVDTWSLKIGIGI